MEDLKAVAVKANEDLKAAAARLQFNEQLEAYTKAFDKLVAKARDVIPAEGGTFMCPGLFISAHPFRWLANGLLAVQVGQ